MIHRLGNKETHERNLITGDVAARSLPPPQSNNTRLSCNLPRVILNQTKQLRVEGQLQALPPASQSLYDVNT